MPEELKVTSGELDRIKKERDELAALLLPQAWWDDNHLFDSPEEYAEEEGLTVGAEFDLQAAVYWPETYRVISDVPDNVQCERVAGKPMLGKSYVQMRDRAEAAEKRVAELEAERRWIRCSERMPEPEKYVQVVNDPGNSIPHPARTLINNGAIEFWWGCARLAATHWREIGPLPYFPSGKDSQ